MNDISMILERTGRKLVVEVSPHLEGHYAGGHVVMAGLLTQMAAEQFDGLVERLLMEISDMRTLLMDGGVDVPDTRARSFKVSSLQAVHNDLSEKLIDLQSSIETSELDKDRTLNVRIWQFFVSGAEARMPTMPDFAEARAKVLASLQSDAESGAG